MRNIALKLRFDGTAYHGWQAQAPAGTLAGPVTVAGTVQRALGRMLGRTAALYGCGRTDAGVHAQVYVANFRTDARMPVDRMPYALNALLPPDIAVLGAAEVSDGFHAAYACVRKEYTYKLYHAAHRDPFLANRAFFYKPAPQLPLWQNAAAAFVGKRDFASVRSQGTPVRSTVRHVFAFEVYAQDGLFCFRVAADGFLYNMVRAMVGTILYAGEGKITDVDAVLALCDRRMAGPTVPPHGLYMTDARYEEPLHWQGVSRHGEKSGGDGV